MRFTTLVLAIALAGFFGSNEYAAAQTTETASEEEVPVPDAQPAGRYLHPSGLARRPERNNLIHPNGYQTAPLGTLGGVIRHGTGPVPMVLLPGLSLSADIYRGFMEDNADRYTMYAVTPAGFGETSAPPMPASGTPWTDRTWSRAFEQAVIELIEQESLDDIVLVGHFTGGSLHAMKIATARPDLVSRVVLLSGEAERGQRTDDWEAVARRAADEWFATVTPQMWAIGNYVPGIYSRNEEMAQSLWRQSQAVPLSVNIRYLLELTATDTLGDFEGYEIPTLVLTPDLADDASRGSRYFFQRSWEGLRGHPALTIDQVDGARAMLWLDRPQAVYDRIADFLTED